MKLPVIPTMTLPCCLLDLNALFAGVKEKLELEKNYL